MSLSRLLLAAASSKKYITGEGNDKAQISSKSSNRGSDPYEGEVILCFTLDSRNDKGKRALRSLGIQDNDSRCDGLIFYAQDGEENRTICLVEMKSTDVRRAADQIIATKQRIEKLLTDECNNLPTNFRSDCLDQITAIKWKACLFHHTSSQNEEIQNFFKKLTNHGFADVDTLDINRIDIRPLLTGTVKSAKERAGEFNKARRNRRHR